VSSFQVLGAILAGLLGIIAGMVAMAVYQLMRAGRGWSWAGVSMLLIVLAAALWIGRATTQLLP
jgi:hypothetical protein